MSIAVNQAVDSFLCEPEPVHARDILEDETCATPGIRTDITVAYQTPEYFDIRESRDSN